MTGFLKTTLSASLISTGILFLFTGITNHPLFNGWHGASIVVGAIMIILAIGIVMLIDQWKDKKKKEELETINEHIEERAMHIAEEKVFEAMEKLEK